jgi:hypothetical protein
MWLYVFRFETALIIISPQRRQNITRTGDVERTDRVSLVAFLNRRLQRRK